jgi:hypothetical protein
MLTASFGQKQMQAHICVWKGNHVYMKIPVHDISFDKNSI